MHGSCLAQQPHEQWIVAVGGFGFVNQFCLLLAAGGLFTLISDG